MFTIPRWPLVKLCLLFVPPLQRSPSQTSVKPFLSSIRIMKSPSMPVGITIFIITINIIIIMPMTFIIISVNIICHTTVSVQTLDSETKPTTIFEGSFLQAPTTPKLKDFGNETTQKTKHTRTTSQKSIKGNHLHNHHKHCQRPTVITAIIIKITFITLIPFWLTGWTVTNHQVNSFES